MIGMGYVILLDQSGSYSLFHRMIDNISVGITQIYKAHTAVIYILKYLLYPAVIHINKKNTVTNRSEIGKFNISRKRNYPIISVITVVKNVLDMRGGKMNILDLIKSSLKPFLCLEINSRLSGGYGRCRNDCSVLAGAHDTCKVILVCLI